MTRKAETVPSNKCLIRQNLISEKVLEKEREREGRILTGTPLYPNCLKSGILSGIWLGVDEQPVPYT